jgi:hypothetical protein
MIAVPPVLALGASSLHKYPLVGRTLLFTLPAIALCIGEGLRVFVSAPTPKPFARFGTIVALVCLAAIAIQPVGHIAHPRTNEEMKPALRYLGVHQRRGDVLYVSSGAQYALAYYHLCGCSAFDPAAEWPLSMTAGPSSSSAAVRSRTPNLIIESGRGTSGLEPLLGRRRVWILFAELSGDARDQLFDYLGTHGRVIQRFRSSGPSFTASVYLYDLGK